MVSVYVWQAEADSRNKYQSRTTFIRFRMFARATQVVRKRKDFSMMKFVQYLKENKPQGEHYNELKRLVSTGIKNGH